MDNSVLEGKLASPSSRLIEDLEKIEGDFCILGLGGKMGPSLTKLLLNGLHKIGKSAKVYGVSRFSDQNLKNELIDLGVEILAGDLLDKSFVASLPEVENVIHMAGNKFGTTGNEHYTWAMNTHLPSLVAEKFKDSRIVVFSTGNVYPLVSIKSGGSTEASGPNPLGEYAQSCLGRERMFEYFSNKNKTPMVLFRLNYATDCRYGVIQEIAKQVHQKQPIDLTMGHANVIWQGDANEFAIRSLLHCTVPPNPINVSGPELLSVKWVAEECGRHMDIVPTFINDSEDTALLTNTGKANELFGYPSVSISEVIKITAQWIMEGGEDIGKPSHFQERKGKY